MFRRVCFLYGISKERKTAKPSSQAAIAQRYQPQTADPDYSNGGHLELNFSFLYSVILKYITVLFSGSRLQKSQILNTQVPTICFVFFIYIQFYKITLGAVTMVLASKILPPQVSKILTRSSLLFNSLQHGSLLKLDGFVREVKLQLGYCQRGT